MLALRDESERLDPAAPPVAALLGAMGGAERLRSVRTFMRETLVLRSRDGRDMVPIARVLTHRAAGGRIRLERLRLGPADGRPPPSAHLEGSSRAAPHLEVGPPPAARFEVGSRPAVRLEVPSSLLILNGGAAPPGAAGLAADLARAKAEAAAEPRNLLAHLHERRATVRTRAGGMIEIALLDEALVYGFDPVTHLCRVRDEPRAGARVRYEDWRVVAGIATPFRETHESAQGALEMRVVAIAYNLPLPAGLFQPSS